MFNKYFDNINVINLDRRPDRLQLFNDQCDKFGIFNVNRFSAIDGANLNPNPRLLNGELGCMESHLQLIQTAKHNNLDSILIMEDDCIFLDDAPLILDRFMNEVPTSDIIFFGATFVIPPTLISTHVYRCNASYALHCYVVFNSAYDKILNICKDRAVQIDVYYNEMIKQKLLTAYIPNPPFATQAVNFSDIQQKVVDYSNYINII